MNKKPILVKVKDGKDYYFTFLQMFKEQLKIKSMTDIHVLTNMCMNMDYNSTRVTLPSSRRKEFCDIIKIKNTHLSNSLKRLIDLGLIAGSDGTYDVNPFLAWKGTLLERDRLLQTKGIEIKVLFKNNVPEVPYNPMNGGSKEYDK